MSYCTRRRCFCCTCSLAHCESRHIDSWARCHPLVSQSHLTVQDSAQSLYTRRAGAKAILTPRRACELPSPAVNRGVNDTALEGNAELCLVALADRVWQLHLACMLWVQNYTDQDLQDLRSLSLCSDHACVGLAAVCLASRRNRAGNIGRTLEAHLDK